MTVGRRSYWPKAPGWLHGRVYRDVDQVDQQIERGYSKPVWAVLWAEAEQIRYAEYVPDGTTRPQHSVTLYEVRFRRLGAEPESLYIIDAHVWLRLDGSASTAFFQTTSYGRRGDAQVHFERLAARLPAAVK